MNYCGYQFPRFSLYSSFTDFYDCVGVSNFSSLSKCPSFFPSFVNLPVFQCHSLEASLVAIIQNSWAHIPWHGPQMKGGMIPLLDLAFLSGYYSQNFITLLLSCATHVAYFLEVLPGNRGPCSIQLSHIRTHICCSLKPGIDVTLSCNCNEIFI